ncbi:MarR family transcriptional regulator [Cytobacillus firmus]|uniref:MarR family winged helix-turn-helix transcriptional regulator n=1 Tax=Cytobacillus firmus TaxID=1399 RepID=UPI0018CFE2AD|nr:MarR family transcriptional regulator [Cytobacillus firmus]MBG9546053.1 MarR family transcriptional regulator [Cytobacillus firmus]MDD9311455.1 MarR family transcriptional regulator [Cytobacillus firmus]MED1943144.1 MarR family transcriptional regulator [Cytobacillus firmus]
MKLSWGDYISIAIHQTDLTLTGYIKQKLAPFNLAPEQNLILMLLWERDGLSQNAIAETLNKDKTNIARMVLNLERKGFIKRTISQSDRRSLIVNLTEEGKVLGDKIIPITEEFNHLVIKGITEEEIKELDRILTKMRRNVQ